MSENNNNSNNNNNNNNNNNGRGKKNNKGQKKRGVVKPVTSNNKPKGSIQELEDNVFDSSTSKSVEKFNDVIEKVKEYVSQNYKYGNLMIYILEHLEIPKLTLPKELKKNPSSLKKRMWEECTKKYIEKEVSLEEGMENCTCYYGGNSPR